MAQVKQRAEAAIPRGRYGKPDEVTNLTIFLDSTAASSITGTTVLVEGGLFRRLM
jgi:3-oxoacyl-[acyl-carrier protein] reductase